MKKVTLVINEQLFNLLGLAQNADDAAIGTALQNLANKAQKADALEVENKNLTTDKAKLQIDYDKLVGETAAKEVNALLDAALTAKTITVELKNQLAEDYKGAPDRLKTVLAGYKGSGSVVRRIGEQPGNTERPAEERSKFAVMDWNAMDKGNHLADVKMYYPDLYKAAFKKQFGKEPKED